MFETSWDETPEDINKKNAKSIGNEIQQQTLVLANLMHILGKAIVENKMVHVASVKRPDWIKELKQDTKSIEKKLDYIASAIIRKDFTGPIVKALRDIDKDKKQRHMASDAATREILNKINQNLEEILANNKK